LKEWQFNTLFVVAVGGVVLLLIGPDLGLKVGQNPLAVGGIGSILGYVLTQKGSFVKKETPPPNVLEPPNKEAKDDPA
jgi:hypothetical protein